MGLSALPLLTHSYPRWLVVSVYLRCLGAPTKFQGSHVLGQVLDLWAGGDGSAHIGQQEEL